MIVRRFIVPVLAATLVVAACKGDPPPPPAPPQADQDSLRAYTDSVAAYKDSVRLAEEARAREEAEQARLRAAIATARETLERMVNFDYDMSEIRSDAEAILRRKAAILRASPQVQMRIAGHADERGSTEYNLALGNRRAEAVRQFMTDAGLSANRFEIVSFGEERPLDRASNEAAWAQNRRAEFQITAGAGAINPAN